jgi:hypothetical protein
MRSQANQIRCDSRGGNGITTVKGLEEVVVMNMDACERASESASVQGAESGGERERERKKWGVKGFGFLPAGGDRKP